MKLTKICFLLIIITFLCVSCATSKPNINYSFPQSGSANNSTIAVKDYQTVGIIFVNSTEVIDGNGNHTGSKITFEMLLREAARLGADDIINIRIDVNEVVESIPSTSGAGLVQKITYNYTGTALAIRYTGAIAVSEFVPASQSIGVISPDTANKQQEPEQPPKDSKFYIGIIGGGGLYLNEREYNNSYYNGYTYVNNYYTETSSGGIAYAGLGFEYTPFKFRLSDSVSINLGIDTMLCVGVDVNEGDIYPLIPILVKTDFVYKKFSVGLSLGHTIGFGFALGHDLELKLGSGKLFYKYLYIFPSTPYIGDINGEVSVHSWSIGYKFGI